MSAANSASLYIRGEIPWAAPILPAKFLEK